MKNNSTKLPHVLVLTSTFPRWENDTEPAFVFDLSRRLRPEFDVTMLSLRNPGSKKQENRGADFLLSCDVFKGNGRWYIFS